jgi:hypothetical protein
MATTIFSKQRKEKKKEEKKSQPVQDCLSLFVYIVCVYFVTPLFGLQKYSQKTASAKFRSSQSIRPCFLFFVFRFC